MRRARFWRDKPRPWEEDWRNPDMMLYNSRIGLLYHPRVRERSCAANYRDNGTGKPIFRKGKKSISVFRDNTYNKDGPPTKEQLKQVKTLAKAIQDDYILDSILKENP